VKQSRLTRTWNMFTKLRSQWCLGITCCVLDAKIGPKFLDESHPCSSAKKNMSGVAPLHLKILNKHPHSFALQVWLPWFLTPSGVRHRRVSPRGIALSREMPGGRIVSDAKSHGFYEGKYGKLMVHTRKCWKTDDERTRKSRQTDDSE
jgi:hypothetical protein